jgi:2-oxoglutarate dehydrogenase E2 component (dihydrolipoamide succinyltransferase)
MSIELNVPDLGESIEEVQIGAWRKEPGDYVEADEILVEIDSDKATVEFPSPKAGKLIERRLETGDAARVGEVLAILDDEAEGGDSDEGGSKSKRKKAEKTKEAKDEEEPEDEAPSDETGTPDDEEAPGDEGDEDGDDEDAEASDEAADVKEDEGGGEPPADEASEREDGRGARLTPSARRLLREHDYDLADARRKVRGRIDRRAAEELIGSRGKGAKRATAGSAEREERVRMSPLRRTIARRLVEAQQQAALLTTFNEIDMTAVKEARRKHGEAFMKAHGTKLGFMSFFVRAVVEALKAHPGLNARVDGEEIVYRRYHDIGVAIGADRGLVVPVLRDAERLGFAEVERAIADFAERAGKGRLEPDELEGGTFTISNGGIYGSLLSTPIVNPPQSGVLGMHAIMDRPVGIAGEIVLRPMMYVALTYDHRVVDGREAVGWLAHVKASIEDPARLLLEL